VERKCFSEQQRETTKCNFPHTHTLTHLLGKVLDVALREGRLRRHSHTCSIACNGDFVAQVSCLAGHLDAIVEELLQLGGLDDVAILHGDAAICEVGVRQKNSNFTTLTRLLVACTQDDHDCDTGLCIIQSQRLMKNDDNNHNARQKKKAKLSLCLASDSLGRGTSKMTQLQRFYMVHTTRATRRGPRTAQLQKKNTKQKTHQLRT
jgi:hypothetical protein